MENAIARKFKWFWPWQDEQEEGWLRKMSQQGWHLRPVGGQVRVGRWHLPVGLLGIYSFVMSEPRDYVYRLDYQPSLKDKQDYLQLFRDAGWESIGAREGWRYFRKEGGLEEVNEIFTDGESKIGKYKRQLAVLAGLPLGLFVTFFSVLIVDSHLADSHPWWRIMLWLAPFLVTLWLSFIILGLIGRIRQFRGRGTVMKPLPKIGLRLLAILVSVFILVALLDLAGIIVDNPLFPGK